MIEKSNEHFPKRNFPKTTDDSEVEVPNFKFLYRNTPNPERDKSSGVSSDEETTSSSLIPIPDTLRQKRIKLKRAINDVEHSEAEYHVSERVENPAEKVRNSLEELRRKYSLRSETSVALKMNSANVILDDILNSTNLNMTSNDNFQSTFFKEQDVGSKNQSENETSTIESSVSLRNHYPYIADHSHPFSLNYFPPCPRLGSLAQPLHNPLEKDHFVPLIKLKNTQRKKSLIEKIYDLGIKGKIEAVYRFLQKTRSSFGKNRKEPEITPTQQGIPDVGFNENGQCIYTCDNCYSEHKPKRMNFDLLESSEMSQSESKSTEGEVRHCNCLSQRECSYAKVIPKCNCTEHENRSFENTAENLNRNTPHRKVPNMSTDFVNEIRSSKSALQKNEDELQHNDNEDKKKKKTNSLSKYFQENKKYSSQERRIIERTDIYYFDHGNSAYYQTTDHHPMRYTEGLVERTDHYATKFWAEFFGTIEIGVAFLISFILQFYRFLFTSIIRSLTVGFLQIFSDYFFKPLLTIIFNGILQPCLILAYNISTSIKDLCLPISQVFGFFAKEVANIIRSCRLVEVNCEKCASCSCGNKV